MSKEKQKKRHPDYGLSDQVRGRCHYRLASAERYCKCCKKQVSPEIKPLFTGGNMAMCPECGLSLWAEIPNQKQWNCRAGISGWHQENCPHQKQQSDWEFETREKILKAHLKDPNSFEFIIVEEIIKPLLSAQIQQAYNEGINMGWKEGYEDGKSDSRREVFMPTTSLETVKEYENRIKTETLKEVLPKRPEEIWKEEMKNIKGEGNFEFLRGYNYCRSEIIIKALKLWGIKL